MYGDSTTQQPGNFGVQGVPSPTNKPPAFYEACEWTDLQGNFWMYGGVFDTPPYGDMWKFDPSTNMWTWVKGPGTPYPAPVRGIKGVPAPANTPGSRTYGASTWRDLQGNLWLFGGNSGPGE